MSRQLANLQPEKVFYYFEEVNRIPRRSGNEKALSDYMVNFAKKRGFETYQDEYNNVVIFKPATQGYEDAPVTILQGHLDMVCEQNEGSNHNFESDPIDMIVDGEWLTADGTTLGADNGIAIAYALAILDSDDIPHPALEVVMTADEEVGLTGALQMDKSMLKAQYFINLDSEEEGELTVGCAGGLKASINLPIEYTTNTYDAPVVKAITIKGLLGGHSGVEIDKNRANADRLMGRVLGHLKEEFSLRIIDIRGGKKDNVIPREAFATVVMEEEHEASFNNYFYEVVEQIKHELRVSDPNIVITEETLDFSDNMKVMSKAITDTIIFTLINVPNGIQTMSASLKGMVESSLSMGKCAIEEDEVVFLFAVRSNVRSLKYHITAQLEWFARQIGAKFIQTADYPEWEYKPESSLLSKAIRVYEDKHGKKPKVKAIHAGLEPGAFLEKMPHLEAISLGPDMKEVHSPNERLHIGSVGSTWNYLKAILASLKYQ